jgi:uncharacterized protein (TIGR00369 family)
VFTEATGMDVVSAGEGSATLALSPPDWLRASGGGLTAGALAVLAEVALTAAALTTACTRETVVAASLHLEVKGYPLEDGCLRPHGAGVPRGPETPAKPAGNGQLSMTATVQDCGGAPGEQRGPLRRVTGAVTDSGGAVLATASALYTLVPAPVVPPAVTTAPPRATPNTTPTVAISASEAEAAAVPSVPAVPVHEITSPLDDQLTLPAAPLRPLLGSLDATIKNDGNRAWVRFSPAGWQANRAGGMHRAMACAAVDAAVDAALGRVLPAGSAVQLRSLEMTFLRSIPLDADVEAVATVVNVGRRLAVIDCEIGSADSRPCALARVIAARTTHL